MKSLYQLVEKAKKRLGDKQGTSLKYTFVIGNVSADMDSVASSLFLSYILTNRDDNAIVVPVVNTEKDSLLAKKDIQVILDKYQIQNDDLIFFNDVDFNSLADYDVYLVDHNELEEGQKHIEKHIVGIYDHHADTSYLPDLGVRIVKPSASAITIIFEACSKELSSQEVEYFSTLILAPMYLDTDLFSPKLYNDKYFDFDIATRNGLLALSSTLDASFFDQLQQTKISSYRFTDSNLADLLNLDYKSFSSAGVKYGISVIMDDLFTLLQLYPYDTLTGILESKMARNKLNLLFVFCYKFFENDVEKRLLVLNRSAVSTDKLVEGLNDFKVELEPCDLPFTKPGYSHLRVKDSKMSRKKLEPIIRKVIALLR